MVGCDMRIDHRGFDISVAQQCLNRPYVRAISQEMTSKTVPKRVRTHMFHNFGLADSPFECAPQRAWGSMPASLLSGVTPGAHLS